MPRLRIDKIGLVSHYSEKGDWAFRLAFALARAHSFQLNIFNFLESPFEKTDAAATPGKEKLIEAERLLRRYYDDLLDDYVDVGFRVCESIRHNLELRRCLREKEYQVLVIPYLEEKGNFGAMPVEEFAFRFVAPVILVGPQSPDQLHLNTQANLIADSLSLPVKDFVLIPRPQTLQAQPVL